jgi:chromosome segregation ATPase
MKIFNTDNEMKERLEAATTENTELSELVAQREGDIKDITANLAEVSASIETLTAELEESKAASALLETEKTELAAQLEASKEAQVEFDEKVSNAALARMQELGVSEPVAAIAEDDTDDIYTQYTNLKATDPAQAGAFWRANEAEIKASI